MKNKKQVNADTANKTTTPQPKPKTGELLKMSPQEHQRDHNDAVTRHDSICIKMEALFTLLEAKLDEEIKRKDDSKDGINSIAVGLLYLINDAREELIESAMEVSQTWDDFITPLFSPDDIQALAAE